MTYDIIHDCIVAFFVFSGIIFGYLFFTWWLKWFYDNFEIRRKENDNRNNR